MKKRALSLLLCLVFLVGLMPTTALAAGGATDTWDVDLVVSKNSTVQYNGQDTVEIGFAVQSDNLTLKNAQSIVFTFDYTLFDFVNNSGKKLATCPVESFPKPAIKKFTYSAHSFYSAIQDDNVEWKVDAYHSKSADEKYGYGMIQPSQDSDDCPATSKIILGSVLLGFKSGKSFDDLTSTSIRFANPAELAKLNQTSAIEVTNGNSNLQQAIKKDGSPNTLTIPPEVVWNGIKPSEPAKPELKGSVTIDNTNPKFDDTLTAQTGSLDFNGAATGGTLTYQWYRGTEKIIGADKATYTTVAADMNNPIKVEVRNSNNSNSVFSKETNKVAKAAGPAAPAGLAEVSKTDTTITVTSNAAWEYSIDGGGKWQDSNVFTGLTANTTYDKIVARVKTTGTHEASAAISVTTAKGSADSGLQATLKNSHTPYTGKAHPAFTADMSSMTGWTATYSSTETGTYSSTMTTVTNVADSGKIYVKFSNTAHTDVIVKYDVEVNPAQLTVTAKPHTITYGDAPANNGVNITGFVNSETDTVLTGTLEYDYNYTQYGNVGEYTITPKGYNATNYKITFTSGKLTVQPKEVGLTWNNHTGRVWGDGKTVTATATGMVNSDAISVTVTGGAETAVGGPYTATATGLTGKKAGNYKLPTTTTTQSYSIGKAIATDTVKADFSVFYSDTAAKPVAVTDFNLPTGIKNAKFKGSVGTKTDTNNIIGSYTNDSFQLNSGLTTASNGHTASWTVTIESDNYKDITATVNVKVIDKTNANVTITGAPTSKTYGDADFTLTAAAANPGTVTGAWTWSSSDSSVLSVTGTGTTATVKILKAGSATISAKYESDTTMDTKTTASITINKATITVAAKDQSIYVNGTAPDLSAPVENTHYTVTGLVGSDTLVGTITMEYQKSGTAATLDVTKAGTYDIVISGATEPAGGNYNAIEFKSATLTISNPSYSGGGSYTPTYAITVDRAANGTVTAAPGTAKKGDTVTLTATPDKGYELDTIKALDKDGKKYEPAPITLMLSNKKKLKKDYAAFLAIMKHTNNFSLYYDEWSEPVKNSSSRLPPTIISYIQTQPKFSVNLASQRAGISGTLLRSTRNLATGMAPERQKRQFLTRTHTGALIITLNWQTSDKHSPVGIEGIPQRRLVADRQTFVPLPSES